VVDEKDEDLKVFETPSSAEIYKLIKLLRAYFGLI
jgi:hypothetical protein